MSEYTQLVNQLKRKPGRPRLTDEQREKNKQERKKRTALRNEARRRAFLVLRHRHQQEYDELFAGEYAALEADATTSV